METTDGERLGAANSVWTLVNTQTKHPVRIPADILEKYPLEKKLDMKYDSRKIRLPDFPGTSKSTITVQEYHLDTNRHMNNGQYVRIAAGLLPAEKMPDVLRIEYRKQAVLGDRIIPVLYEDNSSEAYVSLNAEDGEPYAIMEMHFSQSC
jgi:acyl-ACP thioesterase